MLKKGTSAADVFAEMHTPKGQYAYGGLMVVMSYQTDAVFQRVRSLIPADLMNRLERHLFHSTAPSGQCCWRIPAEMLQTFHEEYRRILQRLIDEEVVVSVQPDVALFLEQRQEDAQCDGR